MAITPESRSYLMGVGLLGFALVESALLFAMLCGFACLFVWILYLLIYYNLYHYCNYIY